MRRIVLKNQKGMAMFVAVMMLSLGASFALLAWQVSSTELEISRYSESEAAAYTLAESGIEKVISWVNNPGASPNEVFFENLPTTNCNDNPDAPDYSVPYPYLTDPAVGPFKALKGMGKITELYLYKPTHPTGICTVGVLAESTRGGKKRVEVELAMNPLGAITAGIQGEGNPDNPSPVWLHWGNIQYTGSANLGNDIGKVPEKVLDAPVNGSSYSSEDYDLNQDYLMKLLVENEIIPGLPEDAPENVKQGQNVVLDDIDLNGVKRFIKQHGEAYIVSEVPGMLKDHQGNTKSFDELFGPEESGQEPKRRLVWIDTDVQSNNDEPLLIEGGPYKGYFYFPDNIDIQIINWSDDVLTAQGVEPPPREDDTQPAAVDLSGLNLVGLFYVGGKAEIVGSFKTFGALYAGGGFTGPAATDLELWYNSAFAASDYSGVRRVTPLTGTWKIPPVM